MKTGATASVTWRVAEGDTAIAQGSGNVPVFGTPRLVALCEAACIKAIEGLLATDETTVGSRIEIDHIAPSSVGADVSAEAELTDVNGRRLTFAITATEGNRTVGRAVHYRVLVEESRFLEGLG